jgi:hypothetical protein
MQEVTKRYNLSWPTNSALVFEPKCGGGGGWEAGVAGSQPMSKVVHRSPNTVNFGDLTPYLTYAYMYLLNRHALRYNVIGTGVDYHIRYTIVNDTKESMKVDYKTQKKLPWHEKKEKNLMTRSLIVGCIAVSGLQVLQ